MPGPCEAHSAVPHASHHHPALGDEFRSFKISGWSRPGANLWNPLRNVPVPLWSTDHDCCSWISANGSP